jgi:hypothetical protein
MYELRIGRQQQLEWRNAVSSLQLHLKGSQNSTNLNPRIYIHQYVRVSTSSSRKPRTKLMLCAVWIRKQNDYMTKNSNVQMVGCGLEQFGKSQELKTSPVHSPGLLRSIYITICSRSLMQMHKLRYHLFPAYSTSKLVGSVQLAI